MPKSDHPELVSHLAQLAQALRQEGIEVTLSDEAQALHFPTIFGPDAPMFVRWLAADRLVLVSQTLPLVVLPAQAGLLAAALLPINRQLDMVGLLADPERGVVWLRTHLFTDRQGRLDYPLFLTVVAACVQVVRARLIELCVALGREPPELAERPDDEKALALMAALRSFSE